MKKIAIISLLTLSSLFGLEFHSYEEALKLQKQNHKIIMIDVIRSDCHYCSDMDKNVLQDKEMSNYLKEKFIPVKINLDTQKLPLDIKVNFTPTFFFVDKEQKIVKKIPGSWSIEDFKDLTKKIE